MTPKSREILNQGFYVNFVVTILQYKAQNDFNFPHALDALNAIRHSVSSFNSQLDISKIPLNVCRMNSYIYLGNTFFFIVSITNGRTICNEI